MFKRKPLETAPANQPLDEIERLRAALDVTQAIAYEWTLSDDRIAWSGSPCALLGQVSSDIPSTSQALDGLIGAEVAAERRRRLAEPEATESFLIEYPLEAGDRHVRWIEERGRRVRDARGQLQRVVGVMRDVTVPKRSEARLRYLASYDELTGHLNRARLKQALSQTIEDVERRNRVAAYMVIGIDHLSLINEAYGFDTADQVIVAIGHRISALLKPGDVVGRSAGNKFGVILPNRSPEELAELARVVRETMRCSIIDTPRGSVCATISAGGVLLPSGAQSSEQAMARAEEALEQAKRLGRDSYRLYEANDHRESLRRRMVSIADQVVQALNDRRLVLAFQPIVRASDASVVQYECLLRMLQTDGHIVSAGEFVPVTERVGLISLVDQRALELAVEALEQNPTLELSLNVSGMTASDGVFLEGFLAYIRVHRAIASRLTVELTETAALQDLETSAAFMAGLRSLGCRVAIDDFGAGYTSFRNLQVFKVDMVKIDGSFVTGLGQSADNQLFVRTLVGLATNFGVSTVAECVSNAQDAEILRAFGVDYLQGFHFGRPEIQPDWLRSVDRADRRRSA